MREHPLIPVPEDQGLAMNISSNRIRVAIPGLCVNVFREFRLRDDAPAR